MLNRFSPCVDFRFVLVTSDFKIYTELQFDFAALTVLISSLCGKMVTVLFLNKPLQHTSVVLFYFSQFFFFLYICFAVQHLVLWKF